MILDKDQIAALIFAAYHAGCQRAGERFSPDSGVDPEEYTPEERFLLTFVEWSRAERGPFSAMMTLAWDICRPTGRVEGPVDEARAERWLRRQLRGLTGKRSRSK
jgi:hypothetical protein